MIRTALLLIFGRLWKTTIAKRSPTSSLPSPIGRRRGNFLDLSVTFSLLMPMHEFIRGEKLTAALPSAGISRRALAQDSRSLDRCIRETTAMIFSLLQPPQFVLVFQRPLGIPQASEVMGCSSTLAYAE